MNEKDFSFISSRGRGINDDLIIVKNALEEKYKNARFRYFVNSEISNNYMSKQGVLAEKTVFCNHGGDYFCVDVSSMLKKVPNTNNGNRIMMAIPYLYQFKTFTENQTKVGNLSSFTHIITGSPLAKSALEARYKNISAKIINDVCLPFAYDLVNPDSIKNAYEDVYYHFPQIKDKKIISIFTAGKYEENDKTPIDKCDIKKILDYIKEDYFVFTNNKRIMEQTASLSGEYAKCFAYTKKIIPTTTLLYITDVLITNSSPFAAAFAAKRKPLFCLRYKNNAFEKYVAKKYPSLYLKNIENILKFSKKNEFKSDEQNKLCHELSYEPNKNPIDVIIDIVDNPKEV